MCKRSVAHIVPARLETSHEKLIRVGFRFVECPKAHVIMGATRHLLGWSFFYAYASMIALLLRETFREHFHI